ncbi:FliH/SctL family protein [Thiomicrorhabdus aquaedulcis]|uniref:FliH/SctL family protein n=1 Tax=Thiomicrorhabdus aquaedulcis TaxID=2211106 RepID=UPI0015626D52|nr:FliH/SctL family protein [Thiomicrorhabdus aquaedulcis]
MVPKVAQFDEVLSLLTTPYQMLEKQTLDEIVAMALHIAVAVIEREIAQDPQWIAQALQQAINTLPECEPNEVGVIQVQLHPSDFEVWQTHNAQHSALNNATSGGVNPWHVSANAQLVPGSCLVKQNQSAVLNSWQTRFDALTENVSLGS